MRGSSTPLSLLGVFILLSGSAQAQVGALLQDSTLPVQANWYSAAPDVQAGVVADLVTMSLNPLNLGVMALAVDPNPVELLIEESNPGMWFDSNGGTSGVGAALYRVGVPPVFSGGMMPGQRGNGGGAGGGGGIADPRGGFPLLRPNGIIGPRSGPRPDPIPPMISDPILLWPVDDEPPTLFTPSSAKLPDPDAPVPLPPNPFNPPSQVPEPSSLILATLGLGMAYSRRQRA